MPSKSMMASWQSDAGMRGQEEPPGMTACSWSQPPMTPPPWRSMSSRREMDISSSTTQGLLTLPCTMNSLVPLKNGFRVWF